MRGDIHRLRSTPGARGHERRGDRLAVVVQSDDDMFSTQLVAPTSRSAQPRSFRPTITVDGVETQVLVEQTTAVAPERLGALIGRVSHDEQMAIDQALLLTLQLD